MRWLRQCMNDHPMFEYVFLSLGALAIAVPWWYGVMHFLWPELVP